MRNNSMIIGLVAGGLALAVTNLKAQAADEVLPPVPQPQSSRTGEKPKQAATTQSLIGQSNFKATSLIGLPVRNQSGDLLGKVENLIVNVDTHSMPFAIVEHGGTLGIGGTRVAVPLTNLKWSSEPRQLILTATKEQFQAANSAPTGGWLAVADEDWTRSVDRFYGQPSAPGPSRFERQEVSGISEGRQLVRTPADQKGATDLEEQINAPDPAVMNKLAQPKDETLMTKVNGMIHQTLGDRANQVQVTIDQGVVKLSGMVPTEMEKRLLAHQILGLPGVDRVEDKLTIQGQ